MAIAVARAYSGGLGTVPGQGVSILAVRRPMGCPILPSFSTFFGRGAIHATARRSLIERSVT